MKKSIQDLTLIGLNTGVLGKDTDTDSGGSSVWDVPNQDGVVCAVFYQSHSVSHLSSLSLYFQNSTGLTVTWFSVIFFSPCSTSGLDAHWGLYPAAPQWGA